STIMKLRERLKQTRAKKNSRGQISLMIGLMILTLLILVRFVVSIGLLVNAKINLQNAADMAAYAGAAVQARTLNHIGFLNFEMRREFKKFLFRQYVLGGMAQRSTTTEIASNSDLDQTRSWA